MQEMLLSISFTGICDIANQKHVKSQVLDFCNLIKWILDFATDTFMAHYFGPIPESQE